MFSVQYSDLATKTKLDPEYVTLLTKDWVNNILKMIHSNYLYHGDTLDYIKPHNISLEEPLFFWSVIYHSRGYQGNGKKNSIEWIEALAMVRPDVDWELIGNLLKRC